MIKFYKIFILGFILCISSLVNLWGDLSTGLIAWYPFDGNASDMSGSENHATVYGPVLGCGSAWSAKQGICLRRGG